MRRLWAARPAEITAEWLTTFQLRVLRFVNKPPQSSAELASIDGSTENRHDMPSIFLTFRCRQCQQGRCVAAIWWDIRAVNELKDKDFSAPCPDCGHQDVFFGIEAIEMYHGELSAIERMELDEEELREFGLDEEVESEE